MKRGFKYTKLENKRSEAFASCARDIFCIRYVFERWKIGGALKIKGTLFSLLSSLLLSRSFITRKASLLLLYFEYIFYIYITQKFKAEKEFFGSFQLKITSTPIYTREFFFVKLSIGFLF